MQELQRHLNIVGKSSLWSSSLVCENVSRHLITSAYRVFFEFRPRLAVHPTPEHGCVLPQRHARNCAVERYTVERYTSRVHGWRYPARKTISYSFSASLVSLVHYYTAGPRIPGKKGVWKTCRSFSNSAQVWMLTQLQGMVKSFHSDMRSTVQLNDIQ